MPDTTDSLQTSLQRYPFLAGMLPAHIKVLADCAELRQYAAGTTIFSAGEIANGFYLIDSVEVAIETSRGKKPATIDVLVAGEPLGWSWIFEKSHWEYDARCRQFTTVLFFDAAILQQHRDNDHSFGHELYKKMSEVMVHRLQAARGKLADALEE